MRSLTRKLSASRATSFINSVSQIMIRGGSRWKLSTLTIMLCTRTIQFGQDFFHKFPTTVILEKPRSTWDGTNIGGLCPGIQRQNEFPHWQLWIGTKNAVKNWHLLQDCRIKTVCNTMHRSQSLGQEVRCITLAGNMPPTSLTLCSLPILERAHVLPSQHNGHPCIVCAAARRSVKTNGFSAEWR